MEVKEWSVKKTMRMSIFFSNHFLLVQQNTSVSELMLLNRLMGWAWEDILLIIPRLFQKKSPLNQLLQI